MSHKRPRSAPQGVFGSISASEESQEAVDFLMQHASVAATATAPGSQHQHKNGSISAGSDGGAAAATTTMTTSLARAGSHASIHLDSKISAGVTTGAAPLQYKKLPKFQQQTSQPGAAASSIFHAKHVAAVLTSTHMPLLPSDHRQLAARGLDVRRLSIVLRSKILEFLEFPLNSVLWRYVSAEGTCRGLCVEELEDEGTRDPHTGHQRVLRDVFGRFLDDRQHIQLLYKNWDASAPCLVYGAPTMVQPHHSHVHLHSHSAPPTPQNGSNKRNSLNLTSVTEAARDKESIVLTDATFAQWFTAKFSQWPKPMSQPTRKSRSRSGATIRRNDSQEPLLTAFIIENYFDHVVDVTGDGLYEYRRGDNDNDEEEDMIDLLTRLNSLRCEQHCMRLEKLGAQVQSINLSMHRLTETSVYVYLVAFQNLRRLELRENPIGDRGAQILFSHASFAQLEYLDLTNASISDGALECYAQNCQRRQNLKTLILNRNKFTDDGILFLRSSCCSSSLRTLKIDGAPNTIFAFKLSDASGDVLFDSKRVFPALTELSVAHHRFTHEGLRLLETNTVLKSLCLNSNQLGPESARILSRNNSLRRLALRSNDVGNEGATMLLCSAHMQSLTALDIGQNNLQDEALEGLRMNTRLVELNLCFNRLSGAAVIGNVPRQLEKLDVSFTGLQPQEVLELISMGIHSVKADDQIRTFPSWR